MTAIELNEYPAFEDMFSFPPSQDQLALFSPSCSSGEEDFEYGVYNQKPHVSKMSHAVQARAQRQAAVSVVPVPPASPGMKKQAIQLSEYRAPGYQGATMVADIRKGSSPPVLVQPSSLSPSRVKSTTPDIALLFSLFDVLEDDELTPSPASSSPSSPYSTSSGRQTPEAACVPDRDSYAHAVPNMPAQWMQKTGPMFTADPTVMLSSYADVLN